MVPHQVPEHIDTSNSSPSLGEVKEADRTASVVVAGSQDSLLQALGICTRLHGAKSPTVAHTSLAALRQVVALQYDRVSHMMEGQFQSPITSQSAVPDSSASDEMLAGLPVEVHNAYLLFHDLCILSKGEASDGKLKWLKLSTPIPKEVGVELIESIISSNRPLFTRVPAFIALLRDQVCPLIVRLLKESSDFRLVVRLIRTVVVLIQLYHIVLPNECEMFLSMFVRMLEPEYPLWKRILSLEALKTVCSTPSLLYHCFVAYDENPPATKIFGSIAHALGRFVHQTQLDTGGSGSAGHADPSAILWKLLPAARGKGRTRGLDLLNEREPPHYDELHSASISVESLIAIVNALAVLEKPVAGDESNPHPTPMATPPSSTGSTPAASPKHDKSIEESKSDSASSSPSPSSSSHNTNSAETKQDNADSSSTGNIEIKTDNTNKPSTSIDRKVVKRMATVAWCPILTALSFLVSKAHEEALIQHLLIAFQGFTNTAGLLGLQNARDAFLAELCRFALPEGLRDAEEGKTGPDGTIPPVVLTSKNIQAMKSLFNIAHCLGGILGGSWLQVLQTFDKLDALLHAYRNLNTAITGGGTSGRMRAVGGTKKSGGPLSSSLSSTSLTERGGVASFEVDGSQMPSSEDLTQLTSALDKLFESTRYLDDSAIVHLLSSLGTLSLSALANAATHDTEAGPTPQAMERNIRHGRAPITIGQIPRTGGSGQAPRMFAVIKLIETIEYNIFRIGSANIWEIAVGHLNCVINHRDASIRRYGVESLATLTSKALGKRQAGPAPRRTRAGSVVTSVEDHQKLIEEAEEKRKEFVSKSDFQTMLLDPLSELFRSKYEDARELILGAILKILQENGQSLYEGWPVILTILENVAQGVTHPTLFETASSINAAQSSPSGSPSSSADIKGPGGAVSSSSSHLSTGGPHHTRTLSPLSAKLAQAVPRPDSNGNAHSSYIPTAFKCLELIVNEFIECISYEDLDLLIATIGHFCSQRSDPNISFTGIGLLWRVSDYLLNVVCKPVRRHIRSASSAPLVESPVSRHNGGSVGAGGDTLTVGGACDGSREILMELSEERCDVLTESLFSQLMYLSTDLRSEVRNSALKTLPVAVNAHAKRMKESVWLSALNDTVFPLLDDLLSSEEKKVSHGVSGTELGKDKSTGKSVMMLVHYSRDTAEKQWSESRVYALQGLSRVMRSVFHLSAIGDVWRRFLKTIESGLEANSVEVPVAAIQCLEDVVTSSEAASLFNDAGPSATGSSMWSAVISLYTSSVEKALGRAEGVFSTLHDESEIDEANRNNPLARNQFSYNVAEVTDRLDRWNTVSAALINSFQSVSSTSRSFFSEAHLDCLLDLVDVLCIASTHYNVRIGTESAGGSLSGPPIVRSLQTKLTAVQTSALDFLDNVAPLPSCLWSKVLHRVVSYVLGGDASDIKRPLNAFISPSSPTSFTSFDASVLKWGDVHSRMFQNKSIRVLVSLFNSKLPSEDAAEHLETVLLCLNETIDVNDLPCLSNRNPTQTSSSSLPPPPSSSSSLPPSSLTTSSVPPLMHVRSCTASIRSFLSIISFGLAAINQVGYPPQKTADLWRIISTSVGGFLRPLPPLVLKQQRVGGTSTRSPAAPNSSSTSPAGGVNANAIPDMRPPSEEEVEVWRQLQIEVVSSVVHHVLPSSSLASEAVQTELLVMLDQCYAAIQIMLPDVRAPHSALARTCMTGLFQCVSRSFALTEADLDTSVSARTTLNVARIALGLVLRRSQQVLTSIVRAERMKGDQQPLSEFDVDEVCYVLASLSDLRLQPQLSSSLFQPSDSPQATLVSVCPDQSRVHLLYMLPLLSECVNISEPRVRHLLSSLLRSVSLCMGLTPAS